MGILGVALGTLIPAFIIRFSIFPFFALKALEINPGAYFSAYMRPVSFFLFPLLLSSFYTSQIALKSYFEIAITSAIMGCIALVIFFFSLLKVEREQFLTVFRKFVGNK